MKESTLRELLAKKPERVIELAVKGMLPRDRWEEQMLTKLHVYAGAEHPHAAQNRSINILNEEVRDIGYCKILWNWKKKKIYRESISDPGNRQDHD